MQSDHLDAVTGAFSYTGKYIARRLLAAGRQVRTLTGHPQRPNPFEVAVEARPFHFDAPDRLTEDLRGVDTLYSTYWVRFARGGVTHDRAVEHLRTLFLAAKAAGVRRVIHVSITGAAVASPLPYFRGKGLAEEALRASGVSWGIVRPALIFGPEDVLLHNIAWILRRLPVFALFGDGAYPVQPVHVDDLAAIAVQLAGGNENAVVEAVGPETYTYADLVRRIAAAVGRRPRLLRVSPGLGLVLGRLLGYAVGDVVLTREEIAGLMAGLLVGDGPPSAPTRLSAWLEAHAATLGVRYASEVARHFDR